MMRFRMILIALLVALIATGAVMAQDLTETFESSLIGVAFEHPAGWAPVEFEEFEVVVLADSQKTLSALDPAVPMLKGMVTINIYSADFVADVYGSTPKEVIATFLADFPQDPKPVPAGTRIGGRNAVMFTYEDDHSSGIVVSFEMTDGITGMSVIDTAPGSMDSVQPTAFDILSTVRVFQSETSGADALAGLLQGMGSGSAPAASLTESYTVDYGGITVSHPPGWIPYSSDTLDPPGSMILADRDETFSVDSGEAIPADGVFISLYPMEWIEQEFIASDASLDAVWLNILNNFYSGFPEEETTTTEIQGRPARMLQVPLEGYDFMSILFQTDKEQYVFAAISVAAGELVDKEALVFDILESVTIDEAAASDDVRRAGKKEPLPSTAGGDKLTESYYDTRYIGLFVEYPSGWVASEGGGLKLEGTPTGAANDVLIIMSARQLQPGETAEDALLGFAPVADYDEFIDFTLSDGRTVHMGKPSNADNESVLAVEANDGTVVLMSYLPYPQDFDIGLPTAIAVLQSAKVG